MPTHRLTAPIGISDFKKLVKGSYLHVDKTLLIKDIINDGAEVILFPRPRRFGKTMNLSMLKYFFDVNNHSSDLFENLKINQVGSEYMQHQGKYPVIALTLKELKAESFDMAYAMIVRKIQILYSDYRYLLDSDKLNPDHKRIIEAILAGNDSRAVIEDSLSRLSFFLHKHHGTKPYILIDEYDAPILSAVEYDYIREMILFIRNFLGAALKDNVHLNKGILTGIMRISKESIFSGINNITVSGYLSNHFGEHFGFEEAEVKQIIFDSGNHTPPMEQIKQWYNGYIIAGKVVYNPWSILTYIRENYVLKPYWVNTSDNYLIRQAFAKSGAAMKQHFESLIQGKTITRIIEENLTLDDLKNPRDEAIWTLLCLSGYLKIVSYHYDLGRAVCELALPNKEIIALYSIFIERWFSDTLNIDDYYHFLKSLQEGDIPTFHHFLSRFLQESTSHFDLQQKEPERVYHSLVLGMIVGLRGRYSVKSNRESGLGRYDVMLIPHDKSQLGIIIEFKTAKDDSDETLTKTAKSALQQIQDKAYGTELEQAGINRILELGLAFAGKRVSYVVAQ